MTRITATQASRAFADLLNRVAGGEEVEVTRGGVPVAVVSPPQGQLISAERFRDLVAGAPRPDKDYAADVKAARSSLGAPSEPWPS